MTEIKNKYTHSEEVANAASHLVGTIMSIVVCSLFLHKAYQVDNTLAVVSMSLYFFGVLSSYVASSVYHSCPLRKENNRLLFRKFDYAAIYWHIAGGVECD
jgi:hemolysin III